MTTTVFKRNITDVDHQPIQAHDSVHTRRMVRQVAALVFFKLKPDGKSPAGAHWSVDSTMRPI